MIITKGKADVFLLQETKLKSCSMKMAISFWRKEDIDFSCSDAEGLSGGIMILWRASAMEVICSYRGTGFIGIKVCLHNNFYYIFNVYSSCHSVLKKALWNKLLEMKSRLSDGEWLIGGDFNAVKDREERVGRTGISSIADCRYFSCFIDTSGLINISCKGIRFSWYSGDGISKSRLDHFLVSNIIVDRWGVVGQLIDQRDISNHCLLWLQANSEDSGPKPFKFNNEWFQNKEFVPFIEKEWKDIDFSGRGDYVMKEKLRILKDRLRWWSFNVFGKIDMLLEEGVRELNDLDKLEESLEEENKFSRKNIWLNLKIRENMIIQRARIKWLNDEDENNKFFHVAMKKNMRNNHIGPIVNSRGVESSVKEVKKEVFDHFTGKFKEEDKCMLELLFLEEEINDAIWNCEGSMSPGPDG